MRFSTCSSRLLKRSIGFVNNPPLGVFIAAAILTPPDWVSQIFLAIPMVGLYLVMNMRAIALRRRAKLLESKVAERRSTVPQLRDELATLKKKSGKTEKLEELSAAHTATGP